MTNNEGVTGMLFFNTAPSTVYAHVIVWGNFIHPGQIDCMYLLHQPHDGSMFDIFSAGKTMSWDVLLQWKSLGAK